MEPILLNPWTINMDSLNSNYYGYTINVSPKKFIAKTQWGQMSQDAQKRVIEFAIQNAMDKISKFDVLYHEYRFELTQNMMIHAHGGMQTDGDTIMQFQKDIHNLLGFPRLDPSICCKITRTIHHKKHWVKYMNKEIKHDLMEIDLKDVPDTPIK